MVKAAISAPCRSLLKQLAHADVRSSAGPVMPRKAALADSQATG